jgi:radical SAM-linked protein
MPRPVGVESRDELLIIELTSPADPIDVSTRLQAQLPEGISVRSAVPLAMQDRCMPISAEYAMPIDAAMTASLQRAAAELMAKARHLVDRKTTDGRRKKSVDIRAFLREVRVEKGMLVWSQTVCVDGTARVNEVLDAVGLPAADWTHRVIRSKAVFRD